MRVDLMHAKREMRRMDDHAIAFTEEMPERLKTVVPFLLTDIRITRRRTNHFGDNCGARSFRTCNGHAWESWHKLDERVDRDEPLRMVQSHGSQSRDFRANVM